MPTEPRYWFPAKRYGWGWGIPQTWQGWVVVAAFTALLIAGTIVLTPARQYALYLAYVVVLSTLLFVVCWLNGEPLRWRWGGSLRLGRQRFRWRLGLLGFRCGWRDIRHLGDRDEIDRHHGRRLVGNVDGVRPSNRGSRDDHHVQRARCDHAPLHHPVTPESSSSSRQCRAGSLRRAFNAPAAFLTCTI